MTFTALPARNTGDTGATRLVDINDEDRMPPTYGDHTMATSDMHLESGNFFADANTRFDRDPTRPLEEQRS